MKSYPVWHLGDLLNGGSAADVRSMLGETASLTAASVGENECWRYRFLGGASLTLQFRAGVVQGNWFDFSESLPRACQGKLGRSVNIPRAARPPVVAVTEPPCGYWM